MSRPSRKGRWLAFLGACVLIGVVRLLFAPPASWLLPGHGSRDVLSVFDDDAPIQRKGAGALFFAYGSSRKTVTHFSKEAVLSARRFRKLNPSLQLALVTNTENEIIRVAEEDIVDGVVPKWKGGKGAMESQWQTRLMYLSRTPFELTLALDSQGLACSADFVGGGLEDMLAVDETDPRFFDFAQATFLHSAHPHNWALLYRANERTGLLLRQWLRYQHIQGATASDQNTLYAAEGVSLRSSSSSSSSSNNSSNRSFSLGALTSTFAVALEVAPSRGYRRSHVIPPGEVHILHLSVTSEAEAEDICAKVNKIPTSPRVWVECPGLGKSGKQSFVAWSSSEVTERCRSPSSEVTELREEARHISSSLEALGLSEEAWESPSLSPREGVGVVEETVRAGGTAEGSFSSKSAALDRERTRDSIAVDWRERYESKQVAEELFRADQRELQAALLRKRFRNLWQGLVKWFRRRPHEDD